MHRIPRRLSIALLVATTVTLAVPAASQDTIADFERIPSGDIEYRTLLYLEYSSTAKVNVVLIPGYGLSGKTFRVRPDGGPSWGRMVKQAGLNAFLMDQVGCGEAQEPPSRDVVMLMEKGLYGTYQFPYAASASMVIAHEQAAGMILRARSFDPRVARSLVLIDPIGPQGAQPMTTLTPAKVYARRDDPDHLWRTWGFGPRAGEIRDGLDLTAEQIESLVAKYENDQPPYWVGLLTRMDVSYAVREPMHLTGVPALVVRTPAADADQIEREGHVVRWMTERGMLVDRLDLSAHPVFRDASGLPWTGALAEDIFEEIWSWYTALGLPTESGL